MSQIKRAVTNDAGNINVVSTCNACGGTGKWHSATSQRTGECYRCAGKGYATQDDRRRNYGYDLHHQAKAAIAEAKAVLAPPLFAEVEGKPGVYRMSEAASAKYDAKLAACKSKRTKAYRELHNNVARALLEQIDPTGASSEQFICTVECKQGKLSKRWYVHLVVKPPVK